MNIFGYFDYKNLDREGNIPSRTKSSHPYSYEPFVTYRNGENKEINDTVYSDRLYQWDYEKYNKLCEKHFGDKGQYFSNRDPKNIENFLKEYYNNDSLELILIEEGCNYSSGYPYWIFSSKISKKIIL